MDIRNVQHSAPDVETSFATEQLASPFSKLASDIVAAIGSQADLRSRQALRCTSRSNQDALAHLQTNDFRLVCKREMRPVLSQLLRRYAPALRPPHDTFHGKGLMQIDTVTYCSQLLPQTPPDDATVRERLLLAADYLNSLPQSAFDALGTADEAGDQ